MQALNVPASLLRVPTRLILIAGLHLVVVWALVNGIGMHAPGAAPPPDMVSNLIIEKPVPRIERLIPSEPIPPVIHLLVPLPPVVVPPPDPPTSAQLTIDSLPQVSEGPGTAQTEPTIAAAAVDPRRPLTQPPYPPASIRSSEEGALALDVLVGTDGHVKDAKVARSSGSARLDGAAMNEAKTRWRLRPATRNGVPFEQWLTLRVVFRLENR
jgi:periplasmic protein TonB